MKSLKNLMMALVALTIISCSKDKDLDNQVKVGDPAKISIIISGDGDKRNSRATGTPVDAEENVIKDLAVFLFYANGQINITNYFLAANLASGSATITGATTTATEVYIVANTGATAASEGIFAGITTLDQLKAVTGDLGGATSSQITANGLWMHGNGGISWAGSTGTADIALGFSAARVDVIIKDTRVITNYTFTENKVALLFAGKGANFFSATPSTQTDFYSGIATTTTAVVATSLLHENVDFTANAGNTQSHHFYTFGNDSDYVTVDKKPTILTLSSLRTKSSANPGGVDGTVFYPVHFSAVDGDGSSNFASIEPGKRYIVTISLTGDGAGTTDPEVPVVSSNVTVNVTVADWTATIIMDKEFD